MAQLQTLYSLGFPHEELFGLVTELVNRPDGVWSLVSTDPVADAGAEITGHIAFTRARLGRNPTPAWLLGPLCVLPACQRTGIGGSLVRHGLAVLKETEPGLVCVLGDPAYYGRFGFNAETRVRPPYELPAEWLGAWQSLEIGAGAREPVALQGTAMELPPPWMRAALWQP